MPVYLYSCPTCNVELEVIRSIEELDNPFLCPTCKVQMKRVPTTSSFRLKGQGWTGKDIKEQNEGSKH